MATKINVRTPFYKKFSFSNLYRAAISVYIYEGVQTTDRPASPQYSLIRIDEIGNDYVMLEMSKLIRDWIETYFDGTYESETVWVDVAYTLYNASDVILSAGTIDEYVGFDGYNYHDETQSASNSFVLLQSNQSFIVKPEDQQVIVPVYSAYATGVYYLPNVDPVIDTDWEDTESVWECADYDWSEYTGSYILAQSVSTSTNTNGQIVYAVVPNDVGYIKITSSTEDDIIIKVINTENTKYTDYKVTFINKFGALQDLWFSGATRESVAISSAKYKSINYTFALGSFYSSQEHQYKRTDVNAKESLSLNTGYVDQDYNAVIEQLLSSEKIWITKDGSVYPVTPITSSLQYKTSVNDKLINYTLDFNYAFDYIY